MRFFLIASAVLFIFALIACIVSTHEFLTAGATTWIAAGLLAWVLDDLLGGYVVRPAERQPK